MALLNNLVGHNLEKFGMVTVLDATFYDVNTGEALIQFDTLKVSNISAEGSMKEIRGGQGAELLLTYDYGRTANVEITDALASMYSLEYLWGGKLATNAFVYPKKVELTVATIDTVPTLAGRATNTPVTVLVHGATVTRSFDATNIPTIVAAVGTKLTVFYIATSDTPGDHVHQLTLTSTDFPPIVKLVGDTFLIDQSNGKKVAMQIEIPRFKLDTNFAFTLEAEGDASVFDFSGVALSDAGNIMFLRTLGEEE